MSLDDLQHPDCRACEERKRLSLGQMAENRHLKEALAEEPDKWSFKVLLAVGDALLAEVYTEDIFPRSDCIDAEPGPALVRAVRACREAMKQEAP
ncbi:MAG TPA: hypothetical protein VI039_13170 [Solirubrobacterales bacterium]